MWLQATRRRYKWQINIDYTERCFSRVMPVAMSTGAKHEIVQASTPEYFPEVQSMCQLLCFSNNPLYCLLLLTTTYGVTSILYSPTTSRSTPFSADVRGSATAGGANCVVGTNTHRFRAPKTLPVLASGESVKEKGCSAVKALR